MAEHANTPLRVMTSESSWRCHRSYAGKEEQVRHARAFAARVLGGSPRADDAALLISELCTNAVQHSNSRNPGGTFTVHVEVHEGEYLWAEVQDCGGLWMIKRQQADGRGHGLEIVDEIASDWGRDGDPVTGWVVWFRLDWPRA
jgi:serine/threonine-protein kinase RsbW